MNRLSGFTAHAKPGEYGGVNLNGKQDNAHETFVLRERYKLNFEQIRNQPCGFWFCKTAYKPYDVVVTACLAALKNRLGDMVNVSSDGEADDWQAGVKLARRILQRKIGNPLGETFNDKFERIVNNE